MSCWTKTEENHGGADHPHGDQRILQTAGVGMLVEVMQIVIDPEAVQHSRVAEACYEILGVESYRTFSIIVMVLLILVFVVKNLFTYVQQKLTLSFVYTNQFYTSERMMQ